MTRPHLLKRLCLGAMTLTFGLACLVTAPVASAKSHKLRAAENCRIKKKENQTDGVIVGGATGALAGNMIAGKKHKTTGTLLGAVAGAVVGSEVGKNRPRCAKLGK